VGHVHTAVDHGDDHVRAAERTAWSYVLQSLPGRRRPDDGMVRLLSEQEIRRNDRVVFDGVNEVRFGVEHLRLAGERVARVDDRVGRESREPQATDVAPAAVPITAS
jgi:hypothetical protein